MRFPSFFHRPLLGVQITDQCVRLGNAQTQGQNIVLSNLHKADLPELAVSGGRIQDSHAVAKVLRDLLRKADADSGTDIALCVSASLVYSSIIRVPLARVAEKGNPMDLVERAIPEAVGDLLVGVQTVKKDLLGEERAVLCMRRDIFQSFSQTVAEAGLHIASIVTLPTIVSAVTHEVNGGVAILLPTMQQTMTAFAGGWPVDEAVLAEADEKTSIAEAGSIASEAAKFGRPLSSWTVVGPESFVKAFSTLSVPPVSAHRLSQISEKQWEWLGVLGGIVTGSVSGAFVQPSLRRKRSTEWFLLAFSALLFAMTGLMVWSRMPAPDPVAPVVIPVQQSSASSVSVVSGSGSQKSVSSASVKKSSSGAQKSSAKRKV